MVTMRADLAHAQDDGHAKPVAWIGQPRVIYHQVRERVESLKRARRDSHVAPAEAARGDDGAAHASDGGERRGARFGEARDPRRSFSWRSNRRNERKRLVNVVFDAPGKGSREMGTEVPRVEVTVVDPQGAERRAVTFGGAVEPVDVGSVLVVRSMDGSGSPLAAYLVGDEKYQVGRKASRGVHRKQPCDRIRRVHACPLRAGAR